MIVWAFRNFGSSATICCIRGSGCPFWTIFSHNHYLHHKDLGAPYQRKEIALKSPSFTSHASVILSPLALSRDVQYRSSINIPTVELGVNTETIQNHIGYVLK